MQEITDFEFMTKLAEARALSNASFERELTNREAERLKDLMNNLYCVGE